MADEPRIKASELSDQALFSLEYALAVVIPETQAPPLPDGRKVTYKDRFEWLKGASEWRARQMGAHVLTPGEYKNAIRKGLAELAERGIIALARDAEGGHEPAQVFLDRIEFDRSMIIAGEGR